MGADFVRGVEAELCVVRGFNFLSVLNEEVSCCGGSSEAVVLGVRQRILKGCLCRGCRDWGSIIVPLTCTGLGEKYFGNGL